MECMQLNGCDANRLDNPPLTKAIAMYTTHKIFSWQRRLCCGIGLLLPLAALAGPALDINTATEADLDSLKGVGPATTQRLLAERGKAPFVSWADLMTRVKGLRPPTARKLSDQGLEVNGMPFEGTAGQPQPALPNPPPPGV